jgi:hypothetical protein
MRETPCQATTFTPIRASAKTNVIPKANRMVRKIESVQGIYGYSCQQLLVEQLCDGFDLVADVPKRADGRRR